MKHLILGTLAVLGAVATVQGQKSIIAPGAEVEKLADGFRFTEGPTADKRGNVFFTDQPNDRILEWTVDGQLVEFSTDTPGRANGMYFGRSGELLVAADFENEIWSVAPDGSHTVLVGEYDGGELNGPNDLWEHPGSGAVYFTDPLYVRPWWKHRSHEIQQDGEHVYLLTPDRTKVIRVADDLVKPNGIVGTPDGKTLYVADIEGHKTWAYDINPDGTLSGKRFFAPIGSDGMTIDGRGNVYLTGKGVTVFNPRGEQIEHIDVPVNWTANVCFGGRDRKTLFITASEGLYSLRMRVKGIK